MTGKYIRRALIFAALTAGCGKGPQEYVVKSPAPDITVYEHFVGGKLTATYGDVMNDKILDWVIRSKNGAPVMTLLDPEHETYAKKGGGLYEYANRNSADGKILEQDFLHVLEPREQQRKRRLSL